MISYSTLIGSKGRKTAVRSKAQGSKVPELGSKAHSKEQVRSKDRSKDRSSIRNSYKQQRLGQQGPEP